MNACVNPIDEEHYPRPSVFLLINRLKIDVSCSIISQRGGESVYNRVVVLNLNRKQSLVYKNINTSI